MTRSVQVPNQRELEAIWEDRVRRWAKSGLTATDFAKEEGITAGRLYVWSSRLRRRARGKTAQEGSLLPVVVAETSSPTTGLSLREQDARIEIVVQGGLVVHVREDVDAEVLRRIVAALGGAR